MWILLVDDSETMLSMTRSVVAAMGAHRIEEARNGQEAARPSARGSSPS